MPIVIKSAPDITKMRAAGQLVALVHHEMKRIIAPGVTTGELDERAREILAEHDATPSFLGYHGYPAGICVSVGSEIVHGIPGERVLQEGEIVSVDIGAYLDGFHGDAAVTYAVGNIGEVERRLIETTQEAFWVGFRMARAGNRMGDVSAAIQDFAESAGYGVVRHYGGHGIGRQMHEEPPVLNYGEPGTGPRLQPGMTFAIEPMLTVGSPDTRVLEDGWTVVTVDGQPSAHYEHTVLITEGDPEALTLGD